MIYTTISSSPMGEIRLFATEEGLTGLWLIGQKHQPNAFNEDIIEKDDLPLFIQTKEWLKQYFNQEKPPIDALPLAPEGSDFRQAVWRLLCDIPYGEVTTYGDIAKAIAEQRGLKRMSAQAVGGAVGHNPISIIIPCHRVVGTKGNLTGYGGGIDKKIQLLTHEGVNMEHFFVPRKGTAL